MTTAARTVLGTQLKREDSPSSGTFTLIPECHDCKGPSPVPESKECTTFESDAKEFKVVNVDPGVISFTMYYLSDNPVHQAMRADAHDVEQPVRNYQRIDTADPSPETESFSASITKWDRTATVGEFDTVEVEMKLSGLPTFA